MCNEFSVQCTPLTPHTIRLLEPSHLQAVKQFGAGQKSKGIQQIRTICSVVGMDVSKEAKFRTHAPPGSKKGVKRQQQEGTCTLITWSPNQRGMFSYSSLTYGKGCHDDSYTHIVNTLPVNKFRIEASLLQKLTFHMRDKGVVCVYSENNHWIKITRVVL